MLARNYNRRGLFRPDNMTVMPGEADTQIDPIESARSYYAREINAGVDRYFQRRVDACTWCGSSRVRHRVTCSDLRQFKPGSFRLDECRDCGHVFQNPALTDEGLAFYYRDAYDGINAERADANFSSMAEMYRRRAVTVASRRPDPPRRWLDVGTASAHFCEGAARIFPDTVFDGLDMSDGVLAGQRAGRIDTGYQGQFPELSRQLAGKYDQISMIHYLEHTRDPLRELDAAVEVLADDGWLLIEQPNPHARAARIFRSWWAGWNQPEHLNMVTLDNLVIALQDRGLEIVDVVQRDAHVPLETFIALATALNRIAPAGDTPWDDRPQRRYPRLRRLLGKALCAPLVPVARFVDHVVLPRLLHSYHAYRVLARKVAGGTETPSGHGAPSVPNATPRNR